MLRKIRQARGDPAFLEESAAALWREASRRQVSTAKHLEHVMGPSPQLNHRGLTPELFRDRVLKLRRHDRQRVLVRPPRRAHAPVRPLGRQAGGLGPSGDSASCSRG